MVSSVLHGLDPAVGKGDGVRAGHNTIGIAGLSGVEVGLGVVIGNTVGVGVRLRGLLHVHGRGSVHDRGGVVDGVGQDRGSVDSMMGNCVMGHGVSNNRGSSKSMVGDRGSVHQRGVVGDSVVGNRVGNGVDCMVGRHNLAMSAVGHSGEASVGEVGAG